MEPESEHGPVAEQKNQPVRWVSSEKADAQKVGILYFCDLSVITDECLSKEYELQSMAVHVGESSKRGHYVAYGKRNN